MVQRKKPRDPKLSEASNMWGKFQQTDETEPTGEDIETGQGETVTTEPPKETEQPTAEPTPPAAPSSAEMATEIGDKSIAPRGRKTAQRSVGADVVREVTDAQDALLLLTGRNAKIYRTTSFRVEEGLMREFNDLFVERGAKTKAINHALRLVIDLAKGK